MPVTLASCLGLTSDAPGASVPMTTIGLNGDANGDGVVNAADVVKVTIIIMGE